MVSLSSLESNSFVYYVLFETKYSRMDQVKFVEYICGIQSLKDFIRSILENFVPFAPDLSWRCK